MLLGAVFSVAGYLTSENVVSFSLELSRVIVFGLIGGACGYLGRLLIISIIKKLKPIKGSVPKMENKPKPPPEK